MYPVRLNALFRLAFATAPDLKSLTLPHRVTSRLIKQKARRRTFSNYFEHSASTACRRTVSSSISLPLSGFFSSFLHSTGSLSVVGEYLALPDGPGRFLRDFSCPAVLGRIAKGQRFFNYGAFTLYGQPFHTVLLNLCFLTLRTHCNGSIQLPTTPILQRLQA